MLLAGRAASARGIPVVLDPVGAGATKYRTETARRILHEVAVTVLRGNQGEVATLVGAEVEVRGVESMSTGLEPPALARRPRGSSVSSLRSPAPSTTSPTASESSTSPTGIHCSPPSRAPAASRLGAHRLLPRREAARAARGGGRGARRVEVAAEDAAAGADGPGTFHASLYDALAALDPDTLDGRARISES